MYIKGHWRSGSALTFRSRGSRFESRTRQFFMLFCMLIFFYLTAILDYSQGNILYYKTFTKYSKMTKVKNQGVHPSKFWWIFPLTDLQIFLKKLKKGTCCLVLLTKIASNSVRTTIFYIKNVASTSPNFAKRQNSSKPSNFWAIFSIQL